MHFDLDADERALQEGIRAWCTGRVGSDRVRASIPRGGVDRTLFAELAEQGVLGLCAPESGGGLGLGATHATVVFEELGRALVPGPVVATHLAAGLVHDAHDGTTIVSEVERGAAVWRHPVGVDAVLVVDDEGCWWHAPVDAPLADPPFDPLTPVASAPSEWGAGERVGDRDTVTAWRRRRTLLTSAQLLGAAVATTDLAVDHAREREQFGRAIGSFQSVKHLCADAFARTEVARAAVYAAACHVDGRVGPDSAAGALDRSLATAALLASETAVANAKTCIQVLGGMGFTWEVDAHLYLKRASVWAATVRQDHRLGERLAEGLTG